MKLDDVFAKAAIETYEAIRVMARDLVGPERPISMSVFVHADSAAFFHFCVQDGDAEPHGWSLLHDLSCDNFADVLAQAEQRLQSIRDRGAA